MKKHSAKILTVILAASMILGSAAPSFAKAEEAAPAEEVIVLESMQDEETPAAEEKNEEDVFFEAENVPEEDADTEDTLPADTQEEEEETLPADAESEDPEAVSEEDADAEDADTKEGADIEEAEADAAEEEAPAKEVPAPLVMALPAAAVAEASAAFAAEADEIAKNTGLTRELVTLAAANTQETNGTAKGGGTEESIYDSEGKLKDGTYTVTMSNASNMYKQYPNDNSATVHIVSKDGGMRVSFVMKSVTSFTKLSLTDPETATEYYLGTVGEGTAYCVPLASLDGLTVQFLKSDNTWAAQTTFTFDTESIAKESDDTSNYPLSETEKAGQEDDSIYDSEGKLKDGTYTVTMSNASNMYKQYPNDNSATVHIVSKDGGMRVSFVMKSVTSFTKLSLTDPETATEYYLGTVGEGTAYCVPLASLDGLTVQFLKSDNTWAAQTTFTFDTESIAKESDDTANYPLSETEKAGQEDDSIYDSEGKLKDGTYTVTMSNTSRMYRQYPDNESATVYIVSKDGEMRVSFVMKTTTSFGKLSLTDPETAKEYYLGTVGEGTAYCVPLASLDGLTAYFTKGDGESWNGSTTFTFDAESIVKESDDTANYPLSETEKTGQEEDDSIYDSEGKLKDGTYTVTMSNTSRMYRQYPDNESATVHIVSKDGEMRVSFVMKTTTSFGKLSLTDPETAKEYYLGTVGEGTAYCVPLASLDGLTVQFLKSDNTWAAQTTFTFDAESIVKESNDTANYPLSETEKKPVEAIDLTITNKTGMFKVATASLVTEDGQKYLVFALSGKSYDYMFPGTFEEASANGDGTEGKGNGKWLHYTENADGKWEFKMPVTDDMLTGETIPMVSISNAYYDSFLQGKNKLERAFFPRQFKINEEEKTLETGDYDVNEALTVTNNAKDLTVNKAELNTVGGPSSNNYAENLIVTLKETGFDKAFIGSAADAAAASETIVPAEGAFTLAMRKNKQGGEELFNYLEQDIVISFHDSASDTWKEYKVNASKENMTLTVSALAEDEEIVNPTPAPTPEPAKTDGTTAAVDSSTGLPDGNYTPDSFSFSGGTGKLNITCTNISVRNGQAYATLQFSSKNITYVKASGATYYTQPSGSGTSVEIPVELNKNNRIIAQTVAMSTAHEIEYSIFPYLAAAAGAGAEVAENGQIGEEGRLDDKAPVIPGLTGGEEVKLDNSEYLKIFKYDGGISLIEIDMTKNSVLDPDYLEKHKDEMDEDEEAMAADEEELVNEETGEKEAKPAEEYVADQYRKDIVKYLVAPEKADLPAGLEKQLIIVRKPVKNLYASSGESIAAMEKLGLLDLVKTLGMEEEDIENETLKEALKDEKIFLAGKDDDPDYKTLVKERTGAGFMTGTLLPLNDDVVKERKLEPAETEEEMTVKEYKDRLYGMTDKYATLGIPVLMDRSADEKDEKGAAEWIMVYGLLFDKEEEAKTILDNTLKELD